MYLFVATMTEQHHIALIVQQISETRHRQNMVQLHSVIVKPTSTERTSPVIRFIHSQFCLYYFVCVGTPASVAASDTLFYTAVADGKVQPQHLESLLERSVGLDLSEILIGGGEDLFSLFAYRQ